MDTRSAKQHVGCCLAVRSATAQRQRIRFAGPASTASLTVGGHDISTTDGINEAGLAVHWLYLPETTVTPAVVESR